MKAPSWKTCDENELWRYVAWHSKDAFNQALLVCKAQADKINMNELAAWSEGEGSSPAFQELQRNLKIIP